MGGGYVPARGGGCSKGPLHWSLGISAAHGHDRPCSSNDTIRLHSAPCACKASASIPGPASAAAAKVESTASGSTQPTPPSGRELKGLCSTWPCPWTSSDSVSSVGWGWACGWVAGVGEEAGGAWRCGDLLRRFSGRSTTTYNQANMPPAASRYSHPSSLLLHSLAYPECSQQSLPWNVERLQTSDSPTERPLQWTTRKDRLTIRLCNHAHIRTDLQISGPATTSNYLSLPVSRHPS